MPDMRIWSCITEMLVRCGAEKTREIACYFLGAGSSFSRFLWLIIPLKTLCILFVITVVCHSSIHATQLNVRFRLLTSRTSIVLVLERLMCRRLLLTSTGKVPSHGNCVRIVLRDLQLE